MTEKRQCPEAGTIAPIANAVRTRMASAVQVVDEAFRRIEAVDSRLHAFCTLDIEGARKAAEDVDRRLARGETIGPLAGVPVAIKDLISTKGLLTTFGSRLYASHVPEEDDVIVERLRQAGAIVIGKTNTSEFGYGAFGHNALFPTTRNPWNVDLTPGGSSAGSGAAVAANLVPLAIGSDGGGSVRLPAALCGIYGIKPSWGRVPVYPGCRDERHPGISSWESLEHIGPLTRTVEDAALTLSVLVGPTPKDRASIPSEIADWRVRPAETLRGARIAYSPDLGYATVDPEVAKATEAAARLLERSLGCTIELAHPAMPSPAAAFETLVALETDRRGLLRMAAEQGVTLEGWLARLLAREWTAQEFTDAQFERKRAVNATWRFMERFDFLLTPATACAAFGLTIEGPSAIAGIEVPTTAWVAFSALGNFTGLPTASVPVGLTQDGRPIGLQIMGRHLDDTGVLALSAVVERLYPPALPPVACADDWSRAWSRA
jgi:aspartyl-tRNA(Asn)/glutamyl-tRNA(Gln) amidotransferase subunit A